MKKLLIKTTLASALSLAVMQQTEAAQVQRVEFESHNQAIIGDLYLPDNYQAGDKLPGVIVSGSWTSVKEQMSGGYARELADRGFAALAFDFRGWGQSNVNIPTSLQFVEDPKAKTQDLLAAISFMSDRAEINASKLATLGICASAGYAIDAAHLSDQIVTTASIAPWLHDQAIVDQVYGMENISQLSQASAEAKASLKPVLLEAASDTNEKSVMFQASYYTDPKRGAIPEYDNKFSVLSWQPWLTYDSIQTASAIKKPVLLVHSEAAAIPQGAKKFAKKGQAKVNLVMLDEVTQFDFYDDPQAMKTATDLVAAHFNQHML